MHFLQIVVVLRLHAFIAAEWVEITKKPLESSTTKSSVHIVKTSNAQTFFDQPNTTPSPVWINYQKERFGQTKTKQQSLVVSSGNHLKNSAQIEVHANGLTISKVESTKSPLRNRLIQTSTRIDVVDSGALQQGIPEKYHHNVETTSRRDMSHDDGIVEDDGDEEPVNPDDDNIGDENDDDEVPSAPLDESLDSSLQFPSINGFFTFLRNIQRTWLKKSDFGIEGKIKMLKNLRDNLMRIIEEKFNVLWLQPGRRQRRGLLDESNLSFPSEAALMSINFLTFAVFLIKLVLQVVHIIKSKHYNFSGFSVTTEPISKTNLRQ